VWEGQEMDGWKADKQEGNLPQYVNREGDDGLQFVTFWCCKMIIRTSKTRTLREIE
jgi:hypothetical protein